MHFDLQQTQFLAEFQANDFSVRVPRVAWILRLSVNFVNISMPAVMGRVVGRA